MGIQFEDFAGLNAQQQQYNISLAKGLKIRESAAALEVDDIYDAMDEVLKWVIVNIPRRCVEDLGSYFHHMSKRNEIEYYYYEIIVDSDIQFAAEIRDSYDNRVYFIESRKHLEDLIDTGLISNAEDVDGMEEYLKQIYKMPEMSALVKTKNSKMRV